MISNMVFLRFSKEINALHAARPRTLVRYVTALFCALSPNIPLANLAFLMTIKTTLTQNFASAFHEDAMMVDEPFEPVQTEEAMELTQAWTDIDEMDHQDPQAVTPYVEEIYQNCREKEVRIRGERTRSSLQRLFFLFSFFFSGLRLLQPLRSSLLLTPDYRTSF